MEHLAAWQDLIGSFLDAFEHWRTGQETRLVVGAVVAAEGLLLSRPLWPALWSGVWLIVALAGVGGGLVSLVWEGDRTLSRAERIAAALVAGLAWYWAGRLVGVWLHDPLLSLLPPLLAVVGWLMALAPAHRLALAQSELFRAVFQLPPLTASARARLQARARQQAAGLVTHPNRLAPAGAVVLGTTPADALERLVRRQPLARQALGDANLGLGIVGRPGSGKTYWLQHTYLPGLVRAHEDRGLPLGVFMLDAKGSEWRGWAQACRGLEIVHIDPGIAAARAGRVPFNLLADGGRALARAIWPDAAIEQDTSGRAHYLEQARRLVTTVDEAARADGRPTSVVELAEVIFGRDFRALFDRLAKCPEGLPWSRIGSALREFDDLDKADYQAVLKDVRTQLELLLELPCAATPSDVGVSVAGCFQRPVAVILSAPLALEPKEARTVVLRLAVAQLARGVALAHQTGGAQRAYLVFDEVQTIGAAAGGLLGDLIHTCRSAGAAVVLGTQAYENFDELGLDQEAATLGTQLVFPTGQTVAALHRWATLGGPEYRVGREAPVGNEARGAIITETGQRFTAAELAGWPAQEALARVTCNGTLSDPIRLRAVDLWESYGDARSSGRRW